MATINNSDLCPIGFDLLSDSEGYMDELDDNELHSINGGPVAAWAPSGQYPSAWSHYPVAGYQHPVPYQHLVPDQNPNPWWKWW